MGRGGAGAGAGETSYSEEKEKKMQGGGDNATTIEDARKEGGKGTAPRHLDTLSKSSTNSSSPMLKPLPPLT